MCVNNVDDEICISNLSDDKSLDIILKPMFKFFDKKILQKALLKL